MVGMNAEPKVQIYLVKILGLSKMEENNSLLIIHDNIKYLLSSTHLTEITSLKTYWILFFVSCLNPLSKICLLIFSRGQGEREGE